MRSQDLSQKNRSSVTKGTKEPLQALWDYYTNDNIHVHVPVSELLKECSNFYGPQNE